jgi:hypothetical protein
VCPGSAKPLRGDRVGHDGAGASRKHIRDRLIDRSDRRRCAGRVRLSGRGSRRDCERHDGKRLHERRRRGLRRRHGDRDREAEHARAPLQRIRIGRDVERVLSRATLPGREGDVGSNAGGLAERHGERAHHGACRISINA